jgi:hypothetical protein
MLNGEATFWSVNKALPVLNLSLRIGNERGVSTITCNSNHKIGSAQRPQTFNQFHARQFRHLVIYTPR